MDSHHTGSNELIYIETSLLALTIKGNEKSSFPVEHSDSESVIKVACDDSFDLLLSGLSAVPSFEINHYSHLAEYYTAPIFFEQQRYELIIEAEEGHTVSFWHDSYNVRSKISHVGRTSTLLTGIINFGNDIGLSDLVILVDGQRYLKLTIEVFPSKISYKEDYQAIVTDVTAEIYNLVFDFLKKTYDSFDISNKQQASMVEFFAILKKIYDEMMVAADMVLRNPHHQLQTEYKVLPFHKVKRIDNKSLRWMEQHPQNIIRSDSGVKADKALAVKKYVTYDTKENRLTKYMLERTAQRLAQFRNLYCKLDRREDEKVLEHIDGMINGIHRRCNTGFMKNVDSAVAKTGMSLVFSMAPGYRALYKSYLLLQHGLSLTGNVFDLSVKDLAILYEYWCFIKLNSIMRSKYKLVSQDVIKVDGSGLYVSLKKGANSRVKYINPENGEQIVLSYNPKEIAAPTVAQRPDNVLSLKKEGAGVEYEYVFDAKYRINPAYPGTDYYKTISHNPGPEIGDINTMHRYRDAIVYSKNASPYQRIMFGAYILFPYNNEQEYKGHRFYKSIDQVNIGGLPFLPSATELVTEMLSELIAESPEAAFSRATLPAGIEEKLAKIDWNRRDVLIGTLRNREQLDICLGKRFYLVPKRRISEQNMPIRYVAIYQTKAKFGAEARIEYYGEVVSTRLVKRSEITEIPKDSNEEYYRFEISEWKRLPNPIVPKEVGFPIEFTNLFLLQHSSQIPELLIRSEEEYRFFTELKRRTDPAIINGESTQLVFEVSGSRVVFRDGDIEVYRDGKLISTSSIREFSRMPHTVFRTIIKRITSAPALEREKAMMPYKQVDEGYGVMNVAENNRS